MSTESIRISIPQSELSHLRLLARTDPETLEAIHNAILETRPTLDVDALCTSVAERAGLESGVASSVVTALWRLAFVRRRFELDATSFVEAITAGLTELGPERWVPDDAVNWEKRRNLIISLLGDDGPLPTSAKAAELILEQQRTLTRSRILTDLRPILDEQATRIEAFVPLHTLILTYLEEGETNALHVTLDSDDIERLSDNLDRARRKERLLKKTLDDIETPIIETGQSSDD